MRKFMLFLLVSSLMGFSAGYVHANKLDEYFRVAQPTAVMQRRGAAKLLYAAKSNTPYTGWVKETWANGEPKTLAHYELGRLNGPAAIWCADGQPIASSSQEW